jgi:hypothetical protein
MLGRIQPRKSSGKGVGKFAVVLIRCFVRSALSKISAEILREAKFEKHVLDPRYQGDRDSVFSVIAVLLEELPHLDISFYLPSKDAVRAFQAWEDVQELEEDEDDKNKGGNDSVKDGSRDPKIWAEVDEDALRREDDGIESDFEARDIDDDGGDSGVADNLRGPDPLGVVSGLVSFVPDIRGSRRASQKNLLDNKHGSVILDHDTLNTLTAIRRLSVQGSFNPYQEDFNPSLFLLKIHSETSYNDLVRGLKLVKNTVDSRQQQMRDLVSAHFEQFINCKNTIDMICALLEDEVTLEGSNSRTGYFFYKLMYADLPSSVL